MLDFEIEFYVLRSQRGHLQMSGNLNLFSALKRDYIDLLKAFISDYIDLLKAFIMDYIDPSKAFKCTINQSRRYSSR